MPLRFGYAGNYDRQVNFVPRRNVASFLGGPTLGRLGAAQSSVHSNPDATSEGVMMPNQAMNPDVANAPQGNPNAKPFATWIAVAVLFFGLMFATQHFGSGDNKSDFANIKLSAFNIVVIAIASILGVTFLRLIFTKFYIPGVSELVNT